MIEQEQSTAEQKQSAMKEPLSYRNSVQKNTRLFLSGT